MTRDLLPRVRAVVENTAIPFGQRVFTAVLYRMFAESPTKADQIRTRRALEVDLSTYEAATQ